MRLLLDTRAMIWWDLGQGLSEEAIAAIRGADQVYVSSVAAWEIAIKVALGRLETTRTVSAVVAESGFEELPLRIGHAERLRDLPPLHKDPFDRMLVAQAAAEGLTLVTRDRDLDSYDVKILPA